MRSNRYLPLAVGLLALAGACKDNGHGTFGRRDETWAPEQLTSVKGVSAADIKTAIAARLKGAPPSQVNGHK